MTSYTVTDAELAQLKGKNVIITGTSSGIGYETAKIAHQHGANLILGDRDEKGTEQLLKELGSTQRAIFHKTDVSKWDDIISLFETALTHYSTIDAVISNAGITKDDNPFIDTISPETGKLLPPNMTSLDVNFTSHYYMAKCARYYFSKQPKKPYQIVLTSSAAAYLEVAPLPLYSAAKSGLIGLIRSVKGALAGEGISINAVAPCMTVTPITKGVIPDGIDVESVYGNQPWSVAHALLLPLVKQETNGKAFLICDNEIVELEEKIAETRPLWMGEGFASKVMEGHRRLGF